MPFSISRASTEGNTLVYPRSSTSAGHIQPPPVQRTISLELPTGTVRNGVPAAAASNRTSGEYSTLEAKTNRSASRNAPITSSRGMSKHRIRFLPLASSKALSAPATSGTSRRGGAGGAATGGGATGKVGGFGNNR